MAGAGIIISVILILGLLAAGIVFLVLYLRERNRKTTPPDVGITGDKFSLKSPTEVEASWTSVQPNNMVTLYASTKSIAVDKNGNAVGTGILRSPTVDGNKVKSVSVTGLTPNTTYNLLLVVFDQVAITKNDVVYTNTVLEGEFTIESIHGDSVGGVVTLDSNGTTVRLVHTTDKSTVNDVWEYDAGQFGGEATFTIFNKAESATPETVLYNDKGTLAAENIETLINANQQNLFQWEYVTNTVGKDAKVNQWCLKSDSKMCFKTTGTPTTKPISIQVATDSEDKWKNKTVT